MKNFLLTMAAILIAVPLVLAQQRTITGKVLSDDGNEPLIGANILIKGTSKGTRSDVNGAFSLTVPDAQNNELIVSYIGYRTKEVPVKDLSNITIVLASGKELG